MHDASTPLESPSHLHPSTCIAVLDRNGTLATHPFWVASGEPVDLVRVHRSQCPILAGEEEVQPIVEQVTIHVDGKAISAGARRR